MAGEKLARDAAAMDESVARMLAEQAGDREQWQ